MAFHAYRKTLTIALENRRVNGQSASPNVAVLCAPIATKHATRLSPNHGSFSTNNLNTLTNVTCLECGSRKRSSGQASRSKKMQGSVTTICFDIKPNRTQPVTHNHRVLDRF